MDTTEEKRNVENLSAVGPFVCRMAMFAEHVLSFEPFRIADLRCKRMLEPHQLVTTTTRLRHIHIHAHKHTHTIVPTKRGRSKGPRSWGSRDIQSRKGEEENFVNVNCKYK